MKLALLSILLALALGSKNNDKVETKDSSLDSPVFEASKDEETPSLGLEDELDEVELDEDVDRELLLSLFKRGVCCRQNGACRNTVRLFARKCKKRNFMYFDGEKCSRFSCPCLAETDIAVGVDAPLWDSNSSLYEPSPTDTPYYSLPITGSGQVNGQFTMATINGLQLGIRAQERSIGPYTPNGTTVDGFGIYESTTGNSSAGAAVWNFDWHYNSTMASSPFNNVPVDFFNMSVTFECTTCTPTYSYETSLNFPPLTTGAVIYQSSQNPNFNFLGFTDFDQHEVANYRLCIVLVPRTGVCSTEAFETCMEVKVTDP